MTTLSEIIAQALKEARAARGHLESKDRQDKLADTVERLARMLDSTVRQRNEHIECRWRFTGYTGGHMIEKEDAELMRIWNWGGGNNGTRIPSNAFVYNRINKLVPILLPIR